MFYLLGFFLYLFLLYLVLMVGAYVAGVVGPVAVLVGAALVLWQFARAVGANTRASLDGLGLEPPADEAKGEPAYRNYFFGPVARDYGRVVRAGWAASVRVIGGQGDLKKKEKDPWDTEPERPRTLVGWYRRIFTLYPSTWWKLALLLPGLAIGVGLAVGIGTGAALVLAIILVFALLIGVLDLASLGTGAAVRGWEALSLTVRGITLECPACSRRVLRPGYQCESCDVLHERLLPGSLGLFHRTCRCGAVLPTLLMNGKLRLRARCCHCGEELPREGLSAPTFHAPVVAGPSAGKTAYMLTAVLRLHDREPGLLEFADERAYEKFRAAGAALRHSDPRQILKTAPGAAIHAFNVYVGPKGKSWRRLLYLYDPAGETLQGAAGAASHNPEDWHFLPHTGGLILVLDPFALPDVRRPVPAAALRELKPSPTPPEQVLSRIGEALREHRPSGAASFPDIRAAVVVTKADALLDLGGAGHPYDGLDEGLDPRAARDTAVRDWLDRNGQRNLIASLANTFGETACFAVSALDGGGLKDRRSARSGRVVRNDDPCDPILWLIRGRTR